MTSASPISFASKGLQDLTIPHQVSVDPFTGAATVSVTIPLTAGRADFHPALSLSYTSSSRNSAYGVGWSLSGLPSIGLSVKDGLPQYDGTDTYAFCGIELVPWLKSEGEQGPRILDQGAYWMSIYRSQIERNYLRFETISALKNGCTKTRKGYTGGSGTGKILSPYLGCKTLAIPVSPTLKMHTARSNGSSKHSMTARATPFIMHTSRRMRRTSPLTPALRETGSSHHGDLPSGISSAFVMAIRVRSRLTILNPRVIRGCLKW
jgi:hypothetical protein